VVSYIICIGQLYFALKFIAKLKNINKKSDPTPQTIEHKNQTDFLSDIRLLEHVVSEYEWCCARWQQINNKKSHLTTLFSWCLVQEIGELFTPLSQLLAPSCNLDRFRSS
jgi:hypothetical protein